MSRRASAFDLYGTALALVAVASGPLSAWLTPEHGSIRFWQLPLTVALGLFLAVRRGATSWTVHGATRLLVFAAFLGVFLLNQVARFDAFLASGTDFSTYDRMLYNSWHGRFGYTPVYDVNHFGVHQNWVLLPLIPLHRLLESPWLLVLLNGVVLWSGALPLWRLAERRWNAGGALLLVVAYWTNPWLDRLVDGGFKPEAFYPVLGLTFVAAWDSGRRWAWLLAAVAYLAIKEDAALHLAAFAVAATLADRSTWRRSVALGAGTLAVLALNALVLQPAMLHGYRDLRVFSLYWPQYGSTLGEVAVGMLTHPLTLASDVLTSAWWRVLGPVLLLPLLRWRSALPLLPTVVMLGSTRYGMMRSYDWYYSVPLMAWLFLGLVEIAGTRHRWAGLAVTVAGLLFPLVGSGYLRFPAPQREASAAFPTVAHLMSERQGDWCVQLVSLPRVPYSVDAAPLVPECLARPQARALLSPALDPYPHPEGHLQRLLDLAGPKAHALPGGWWWVEGPLPDW